MRSPAPRDATTPPGSSRSAVRRLPSPRVVGLIPPVLSRLASRPPSLQSQVLLALSVAVMCGAALGWVWTQSARDWGAWLDRATHSGAVLYASLSTHGLPPPPGLTLTPLPPDRVPPFPPPAQPMRETRLSILSAPEGLPGSGAGPATQTHSRLALVVVATDRVFPVAGLEQGSGHPAERLGLLVRTLARQCSDAVLYARRDAGPWLRITGGPVWSCAATPRDRRLPVTLAVLAALALTLGTMANQRVALDRVLAAMKDRFGGLDRRIPDEGPAELRAMAQAADAMLARQQDWLAERAQILAGISHDLGTPTTRLRLRAALIADDDLRARFERDIEQMSGMIEAVLIHTREQMAQEVPIPVSVLSLVQSVADDFADTGASVRLLPPEAISAADAPHLFSGRAGRGRKGAGLSAGDQRMLAVCRPKALRRAVTNLVENALKYGRRAQIEIAADAETLTIRVRDHGGSGIRASELADLVGPFARGANAARTPGSGMGLTIVDGIARQHGGSLRHDDWAEGIVAILTLRRMPGPGAAVLSGT
jgi:signal transduction histidine kinase